jgi:multiple sugar transport system ATP-binding protein
MATVVFANVSKRYSDGAAAVANLDLTIADGEYLCLLGPSGCGKSSTLRMLAGLETVSEGEIVFEGRRVNDVPPQRRDMAMVFENYALYPHLDVFDNIAMPLVARGRPRAEIRERVTAVSETLQLGPLLKMRPSQLSGGQRQRVAVGRAIIREPKMFLLDEPLGHLEAYLRGQLRAEIRRLHERLGATTVHITHDQEEAAAVSDRIAVMNRGRLQQVGTLVELLDEPTNRFVAEFIGTPPINLLPTEIAEHDGQLTLDLAGSFVPLPDERWGFLRQRSARGPIAVGIRPEDAALVGTNSGLAARIAAIEPQGGESLVIGETRLGRLSLFAPSNAAPPVGGDVGVLLAGDKLHLFDGDGISLRARSAGKAP